MSMSHGDHAGHMSTSDDRKALCINAKPLRRDPRISQPLGLSTCEPMRRPPRNQSRRTCRAKE